MSEYPFIVVTSIDGHKCAIRKDSVFNITEDKEHSMTVIGVVKLDGSGIDFGVKNGFHTILAQFDIPVVASVEEQD